MGNDDKFFSQFANVDLTSFDKFALNDLVFEWANFFDQNVVSRVELGFKAEQVRRDWELDFELPIDSLYATKEAKLVCEELDELIWRKEAILDNDTQESIIEMFQMGRGGSLSDRKWLPSDLQSLRDFMSTANLYERRLEFLRDWFLAKNAEVLNRPVMPIPDEYIKSDNELAKILPESGRTARIKEAVKRFFKKEYDQVTASELNLFVENIGGRLYILKKYIPLPLKYAIAGVLDHPNIDELDRNKLLAFLHLFEVEVKVKSSELLAAEPIRLEGEKVQETTLPPREVLQERLRVASTPFVPQIALKLWSAT
eukprot:TRINITY_DN6612_c0_g1_i15.p1 TRINITY_DN6612_c0_g1~~TRINITY_DN6612_c0_g1_i15.p1  ORF type:complete len:327 (+),score=104.74 TRINITY_DN6612_c0_g1_i15:45-983(+)